MANIEWSQDSFSKGELSPYMYGRAKVNQYYNGLRTAQNVLTYPQGAAGKRFGTLYNNTLTGMGTWDNMFFQTFQYLNECVYQIIFWPDGLRIYLEGLLVATISGTALDAHYVQNMDYTILQNRFRIAGPTYGVKPLDLRRTANAGVTINSVTGTDTFNLAAPILGSVVLPVRFTTTGTLPTTSPQIKIGITYFVKSVTTTTVKVYSTAENAKNDVDAYVLTNAGAGVNQLVVLNTWTLAQITFKHRPVYDFDGGYDSITFTPAAASGAAVTVTLSAGLTAPAVLDTKYIGGAFVGGGGVGRITNVLGPTQFVVAVEQPFDAGGVAIAGTLCFLAEPAWSNERGWPLKCSSYQSRAIFANTESLPNGVWASAINDYNDFNDLVADDDDAISWYPTSDEITYIRFIVPYRSLTVHSNSGVFSSPLSFETAITPSNFSLQLQDSTPADRLQPRAIDNQILAVSGNDVHSLIWDGVNNAYTSDIISIMSEQLIRNPIDEAPYVDLNRAGSRYLFIINENGSMAIYQTLLAQSVSGWTPAITEQSYGESYFRWVATSLNGRAWFITERGIAEAQAPYVIDGYNATSLKATGSNFTDEYSDAVKFTTTGSLPTSSPQINTNDYYWVIGVDVDYFKVYLTQEDALADTNAITFTSAGVNSNVVPWLRTNRYFLEELTFDTFLDCAEYYSGSATDTVTGLSRFNAQNVKMVGDGFGFEAQGNNNEVVFEAHGSTVQVEEAYIGFPINLIIEPMPFSMASANINGANTLTRPKHIRSVNFMFNNTIGGYVSSGGSNRVPIALNRFVDTPIGEPPVPARGIFEFGLMKGWDDFNDPLFTIEHDEPFNIELLGLFYSVDI